MNQKLTPQEPGAIANVDVSKIDEIADMGVGDLVDALDTLDASELDQLHSAEKAGKNRTTALTAIHREMQQRVENGAEPVAAVPDILGDPSSYASMRASQVNQSAIVSPVLTLDGWLHPLPSATPGA